MVAPDLGPEQPATKNNWFPEHGFKKLGEEVTEEGFPERECGFETSNFTTWKGRSL